MSNSLDPDQNCLQRLSTEDTSRQSSILCIWTSSTYCWAEKAQMSPPVQAVSPEPPLLTYIKYWSKWSLRLNIGPLAPLGSCSCMFKVWPNLLSWSIYFPYLLWEFCFVWFFTSQSTIFQSCRNGSSWFEPILSSGSCVLLKDTTQWLSRQWDSNLQLFDPQSIAMLYQLNHCPPHSSSLARPLSQWYLRDVSIWM